MAALCHPAVVYIGSPRGDDSVDRPWRSQNQWVDQIFLLHGLKRAAKPADEGFVFGHGKEIYF
ncbi:MAG: hypothetical protein ACI8V0_003211 [Pseudohongiellaceae bacterium]|jgi:hypothetical protein